MVVAGDASAQVVAVDPTDTPAFERWQRERAEETLYLNEVFLRCGSALWTCGRVLLTSRDYMTSKCSLLDAGLIDLFF